MKQGIQYNARASLLLLLVCAAIGVLSVVSLWMLVGKVAWNANAQSISEGKVAVTAEDLNEQNNQNIELRTIEVVEIGGAKKIKEIPSVDGQTTILEREKFIGFDPVESMVGYTKRTTLISFTGKTEPEAVVTLLLDARLPTSKMTTADDLGQWRIDVNVDELPSGQYTATVKTLKDGVTSDTKVIGAFGVTDKSILSNATWMALFTGGLVLIFLLLVVNLGVYLIHRREERKLRAANAGV
jgi:hypothetical protein